MAEKFPISVTDLRGGRNGIDTPTDEGFPNIQCCEAMNVDFSRGPLGGKRYGSATITDPFSGAFTSVRLLARHVPAGDELAAELWAIQSTGEIRRYVTGAWSAAITVSDAPAGSRLDMCAVSFNGKLFFFYDSAVDRLHVWDPILGVIRRVGIAPTSTAPTVANQGAGAYAAVARYYRIRWKQMNGVSIIRQSEPSSASTVFTPSGAGASARITRPANPGEGETHWFVEESTDGVIWVENISGDIVVATTFYDDTSTPATNMATLRASDPIGMHSLFPSAKYGITDNNRLIVAGAWETGTNTSRIWFSPVLGSDDRGDDERWVNTTFQKNRIDTSENNGGVITSLTGPVNGIFWTMKYRQIWRHTPTSDVLAPYTTKQISHVLGSLANASCCLGEDSQGAPAIYFLSHRGPYRINGDGLAYMGRDIEDIWLGSSLGPETWSSVDIQPNFGSSFGVYYAEKSEVWWWLPKQDGDPSTGTVASFRIKVNIKQAVIVDKYGVRGGWAVDKNDDGGYGLGGYCACLFSDNFTTLTKRLVPYVGGSPHTIVMCDVPGTFTDYRSAGGGGVVPYKSYVQTKSLTPARQIYRHLMTAESLVIAEAKAGKQLNLTLVGDFGARAGKPSIIPLDPKATETRVIKKFEQSVHADIGVVQLKYGDAEAVVSDWVVDAIITPITQSGER